jgi:cbb3-type cytochrome oxidase maturation protein
MIYLFFVLYMITGFIISLCLFFWALKNGQFRDQKRARFLPLLAEREEEGLQVRRKVPTA